MRWSAQVLARDGRTVGLSWDDDAGAGGVWVETAINGPTVDTYVISASQFAQLIRTVRSFPLALLDEIAAADEKERRAATRDTHASHVLTLASNTDGKTHVARCICGWESAPFSDSARDVLKRFQTISYYHTKSKELS